jgi:hypothetical protein
MAMVYANSEISNTGATALSISPSMSTIEAPRAITRSCSVRDILATCMHRRPNRKKNAARMRTPRKPVSAKMCGQYVSCM